MTISDGDEVTFLRGSGCETEAIVGTAYGATALDVVVRHGNRATVVARSRLLARAVRWDGRESPMDYVGRVSAAMRAAGVLP